MCILERQIPDASSLSFLFALRFHQFFKKHLLIVVDCTMGKAKQTRKFAVAKKIISPKDTRVKENAEKAKKKLEEKKEKEAPRHIEQANSALFFQYNTQLGPPYHVLIDTNFINFSIRYGRCYHNTVFGTRWLSISY